MRVTVQQIRDLDPCYDPVTGVDKYGDVVHPGGFLPEGWEGTLRDLLMIEECPAEDRRWVVTQLLPPRERRLYACWCVRNTPLGDGRTVWDLLTDPRSRHAVEVAERYADGLATDEELDAARAAARNAARAAARDAARAAARAAAWAAALDAALDAARNAALAAAWAAARAAQMERLVTVCEELEV